MKAKKLDVPRIASADSVVLGSNMDSDRRYRYEPNTHMHAFIHSYKNTYTHTHTCKDFVAVLGVCMSCKEVL